MNIFAFQRALPSGSDPGTATLKILTRRSIDLRRLYHRAANVSEPGLRLVFGENVRTLDLLIGDLQAQCIGLGRQSAVHGSLLGGMYRHLAGWMMQVAPRNGFAWIRLLGHHERALLHAFEQSLANAPPELALILRSQLRRLHGIHLDMDNLAGSAH